MPQHLCLPSQDPGCPLCPSRPRCRPGAVPPRGTSPSSTTPGPGCAPWTPNVAVPSPLSMRPAPSSSWPELLAFPRTQRAGGQQEAGVGAADPVSSASRFLACEMGITPPVHSLSWSLGPVGGPGEQQVMLRALRIVPGASVYPAIPGTVFLPSPGCSGSPRPWHQLPNLHGLLPSSRTQRLTPQARPLLRSHPGDNPTGEEETTCLHRPASARLGASCLCTPGGPPAGQGPPLSPLESKPEAWPGSCLLDGTHCIPSAGKAVSTPGPPEALMTHSARPGAPGSHTARAGGRGLTGDLLAQPQGTGARTACVSLSHGPFHVTLRGQGGPSKDHLD